jgi:hypothetical protein
MCPLMMLNRSFVCDLSDFKQCPDFIRVSQQISGERDGHIEPRTGRATEGTGEQMYDYF